MALIGDYRDLEARNNTSTIYMIVNDAYYNKYFIYILIVVVVDFLVRFDHSSNSF
jgi:hypothetical protein